MFAVTIRHTWRNLFRSPTFWFCLAVVVIVATHGVYKGSYGYFDRELKEVIYDTDPRFILDYQTYIKHFSNALSNILSYSIPIFTVIAASLILTRDYGDRFFEIEKASGVKCPAYLFGRITGLVSAVFLITTVLYVYSFYLFVFTRGAVDGMTLPELLKDSVIRLLRMVFARGLPNVVFFVCLTYCLGSLFKSGISAAIGGMVYAIFCFASEFFLMASLRQIDATAFFDWFHPIPKKLTYYLYYYDTEWFEDLLVSQNTSLSAACLCIAFLVGASLVYCGVSYLRIRKREV